MQFLLVESILNLMKVFPAVLWFAVSQRAANFKSLLSPPHHFLLGCCSMCDNASLHFYVVTSTCRTVESKSSKLRKEREQSRQKIVPAKPSDVPGGRTLRFHSIYIDMYIVYTICSIPECGSGVPRVGCLSFCAVLASALKCGGFVVSRRAK